jgi:hypothetical protein
LETIQRQLLGLGTNISYPNIHEAQIKDAVIPLKNVIAELLGAKRYYPENPTDDREVYHQQHDNNDDVEVTKTDNQVFVIPKGHADLTDAGNNYNRNQTGQDDSPIATRTRARQQQNAESEENKSQTSPGINTDMDVGPHLTILPLNDIPVRYTRQNKRQQQEDVIREDQPTRSSTVTTASKRKHQNARKKHKHNVSTNSNRSDPSWQEIYNILANMKEPQDTQTSMKETEDDETKNFINAVVLDKLSGKPLKYSNLKHTDENEEWEEAEHTE